MMIKTTLVSPAGGWPGRFGRRWVRSQPVPSKEAPSVPAPASARNSLRVSVRALLTTPGEYYVPTGCINRGRASSPELLPVERPRKREPFSEQFPTLEGTMKVNSLR
jgi:hypothetical protein